jgi:hypothetical protein
MRHSRDELVLVAFDLNDPGFFYRITYYDYWYVPAILGNGLSSVWPFDLADYEADLAAHRAVPSPLTMSVKENGIGDFTARITADADVADAAFVMAAVLAEEVPGYQGSMTYLPYHAKAFPTGPLGEPFEIARGETAVIRRVFIPDPGWTYSDMGVVCWVQVEGGVNPSPSPDVPVKHEVLQATYVAAGTAVVPDSGGPPRLALRAPAPNPSRGPVRLAFSATAHAVATLSVHDAAGRRVAVPFDGAVEPGDHEAPWDGRDASGSRVSSGVYFARLSAEGAEPVARKIVLVR